MKEILNFEAENSIISAINNDIRFADVKLETGVQIHYAEQGNSNGLPVILLHGYSDSSFSYSRVMPLMNEKYRVFALDQRGHGNSDKPLKGYQFADFAADVLAFMDAKKLEKAVIVGHSMGSFIAQHLAITAPKRVEKLVLIGSATTIRNEVVLGLTGEVENFENEVPLEFIREFQYGTVFRKLPDEFMELIISESQKLPAYVWREAAIGMLSADSKGKLGKIKAPTLIFWGDKEPIFPRSEQLGLVSNIPNTTLKIYENVAHNPHWEEPEQFVRDFEEFVNIGQI
jgi:pimeloyl-ACP methyl ester carboxylesterase